MADIAAFSDCWVHPGIDLQNHFRDITFSIQDAGDLMSPLVFVIHALMLTQWQSRLFFLSQFCFCSVADLKISVRTLTLARIYMYSQNQNNKDTKKTRTLQPGFSFDKFYMIKLTVHLAFGSILSLELLQFVCLRFHHF